MNILIIGAGPTGLTTALELARRGITPTIVDAKDNPSALSRAVGILPRSIQILKRTGVGEKLLEAGVKIERINFNRDGRAILDADISNLAQSGSFILGLPQDETERIMSKKLAELGVEVQYGRKVTDVETSQDSATATFGDGQQEAYDWIVGADGVLSTVRKSLGITYAGYELEETWSIADLKLPTDAYDTHKITAWMLDGQRDERDAMIMFPMTDSRVRLVSSTPDSVKALPIDLEIEEVLHTGTFQISIRQAEAYRKGQAVLAGDAAHTHSPVGGRGMNLGIEDGQALANALINKRVEEYAKVRKAKARKVIDGTERARKLVLTNNPILAFGLKAAGWLITHTKFARTQFVKNVTRL